MTVRVLIADDQAMVREGLTVLLDSHSDIEVVGEACDGREAVEMAALLHPDVVIMDIRMPLMDGLEACRRIVSAREPDAPKILVVTTFDLDQYVFEALRAGASGFLLKDASGDSLAEAVRVVAAGNALLAPSVTRRLIAEFARMGGPRASQKAIDELTARETEVLVLIAQGMSNGEIAQELVVSDQTVKTHVGHVLTKLGLRDRTQAAIFAYEHRLVAPPDGN